MQCPSCHARYTEGDVYCQSCGADLSAKSTSIIPLQTNLPAVLYNSQLPRNVAASVGALAVGVGIELLRRNLLARLQKRGIVRSLSDLGDMKELLSSQNTKTTKLPRGVEVQESIYMVRRVIRRV
jgi:hypothetical protein